LNDLERIVAYIAPHNPIAAERLGTEILLPRRLAHIQKSSLLAGNDIFSSALSFFYFVEEAADDRQRRHRGGEL